MGQNGSKGGQNSLKTACLSPPSQEQLWKQSFWTPFGPTDDPHSPTMARALQTLHHSILPPGPQIGPPPLPPWRRNPRDGRAAPPVRLQVPNMQECEYLFASIRIRIVQRGFHPCTTPVHLCTMACAVGTVCHTQMRSANCRHCRHVVDVR